MPLGGTLAGAPSGTVTAERRPGASTLCGLVSPSGGDSRTTPSGTRRSTPAAAATLAEVSAGALTTSTPICGRSLTTFAPERTSAARTAA